MGQWIRTYCAIAEVVKSGGSIRREDLQKRLVEIDPIRFGGDHIVESIVDHLAACLVIKGDRVEYDKTSKRYTRFSLFERSIQEALHGSIKNMGDMQLYPYLDRKNSEKCYIGLPWAEIPVDLQDQNFNRCDFRCEGEDSCRTGCGVKEDVLLKYGFK